MASDVKRQRYARVGTHGRVADEARTRYWATQTTSLVVSTMSAIRQDHLGFSVHTEGLVSTTLFPRGRSARTGGLSLAPMSSGAADWVGADADCGLIGIGKEGVVGDVGEPPELITNDIGDGKAHRWIILQVGQS